MVGEYRGIDDMYLHIFTPGELKRLIRCAGMHLERLMPLNHERSGPLQPEVLLALRANGIIVVARR
jgi:hypothetical protein